MGESAEDLRNWRGLYKAALFETRHEQAAMAHRRSAESTHLSIPRAI